MNCFSAMRRATGRRATLALATPLLLVAGLFGCGATASGSSPPPEGGEYRVEYDVVLLPEQQAAEVSLTIRQDTGLLREMSFDTGRTEAIDGDGDLEIDDGRVRWRPPADGGRLGWRVPVPHRRGDGYDAWLEESWGLFRIEDLVPRAATRTRSAAISDTRLAVTGPPGWSVITEYPEADGSYRIERPGRRFSQPTGWVVAGDLGVRRDRIAGTDVTIAGPTGQGVRRIDILALLNWTLPELARILPTPLARLTVVSAGEPMWRGALSAPESFFLHADRPLISENGTSTVLHEVMHVALGLDTQRGYDWIIEGFAEFYSIELLRRSGTVTPERYRRTIEGQREWAASADTLCKRHSTGASTALAVVTLLAVDEEVRDLTDGDASLDDVLSALLEREGKIDLEALRAVTGEIAGRIPDALNRDELPGCNNMQAQ